MNTTTPAKRVGRAVDAERVRAGMSRGDLAIALGWSLSRLQRRLSGDTPLEVDELFQVAQTLGVPVASLVGGVAA